MQPTNDFDEVLSTTRAIRKRLELERAVDREVVLECLRLAVQAPTGSNARNWRWCRRCRAARPPRPRSRPE